MNNSIQSGSVSATLLNNQILCESLYKDLTQFTEQDGKINPDIFVTNYLYFSSFFASERIKLQVAGDRPTNPNLFVTVVANSGKGKSYVNKFFYKIVMDIQKEQYDSDKEYNDFVLSCKSFKDDKPDCTEEQQQSFLYGYNYSHGTKFDQLATKKIPTHVFTITDFTPEALAVKFNNSRNNTLLLNADEFEELQNNIGRGKTVENTFTFLTSYFDSKDDMTIRKTSDEIFTKNAKLCVLANTVSDTFEKLKASNFFSSGLGFRHLFYINNSVDISDPIIISRSETPVSYYDVYQDKINTVIRNFFYNKIYLPKENPIVLTINTDVSLKVYNDYLQKLWSVHIKNNDSLRDTQKETFKARLSTMFNKCILNTFLMNFSYEYLNNKCGQVINYPFADRELLPDDIERGYKVYDYYLRQMTGIFDNSDISDLTETEQKLMSLMEIDKYYKLSELNELADKNKISQSTVKRMMKKESKQFTVTINKMLGSKTIIRHF